jgi:hypothetical protein
LSRVFESLTHASASNATYSAFCTLPESSSPNGLYWVRVHLVSTHGKNIVQGLAEFNVFGSTLDVLPPTLVSSSISPSLVSLGGTVNVFFQLADSSGVTSSSLQWRSVHKDVYFCQKTPMLVSGSAMNATYSAVCTLPSSKVVSGQYTIRIEAQDNLNNYLSTQLGTFQVTGDLDASDYAAPMLVSSSISPSLVSLGGTMNVFFQLADPSGLSSVDLVLQMVSREFPILKCPLRELIIPYSNSTFTYNASCKVPTSNVVSGQYTVRISAQDNLNNYLSTQLGTFQVTGDLDASDYAAPMLVRST